MIKYTQADLKRCIADRKAGKDHICIEYLPQINKVTVSMKDASEIKEDIYVVAPDLFTRLPQMVVFKHTEKVSADWEVKPQAITKIILAAMASDEVWAHAKGYYAEV